MQITEFQKLVYGEVKKIRRGQTATYKQIAERIGRPQSYRAVGNALHKNPFAPQVPCHRVVKSSGETGGFLRGHAAKIKLLKQEGILIKNNKILNLNCIK